MCPFITRALFLAATLFPVASKALEPGENVIDFSLKTLDGTIVSLSTCRGKVTYIDFWASWCPPCKLSIPWMNELVRQFDKEKFCLITVNVDSDKSTVTKFLQHIPPLFTVVLDPTGKVAEEYDLHSMPASFLVNRDGVVLERHKGFSQEESKEREKIIRKAIEAQ